MLSPLRPPAAWLRRPIAVLVMLAVVAAGPNAEAATQPGFAPVCATPAPGYAGCLSDVRTDVEPQLGVQAAAAPPGFGADDLQAAYNLPVTAGADATVAIVDAYDDPTAAADLATYRAQYGLPPCTVANGCFTKVDQNGGTTYPAANSDWAQEISLDLDMVSAACPNCNILLVEAADNTMDNLGQAVNRAVLMGADYVSNSYGAAEFAGETFYDTYFNHPGVVITVSAGDSGYGVEYPAASPYVTAVGGTHLVADGSARGFTETAWSGTGSGCSAYEPKPAWQSDASCAKRTVADVSAVADPQTGVAVYDSYGLGGWGVFGGTSASAPLIAAAYALAGTPSQGSSPAAYPYADAFDLNDPAAGANGSCSGSYLCTATSGFDGPTGLGTPAGVAAFMASPGPRPDTPTGLIATPQSASEIDLSWDAQAGVDAFRVQRSRNGGPWATVTSVSGSATSYQDTGLVSSSSYAYRLLAVAAGRVSDASATASAATPEPASYALDVALAGAGSGTVSSAGGEIACEPTCGADIAPGTQVTLSAVAAAGSAFTGWSGACTGSGDCQVTMSHDVSVTATFVPLYSLSISRNGLGSGTVTSAPAAISCGASCAAEFLAGTVVHLSAVPGSNSAFAGWTGGGCSGTGGCPVTMSAAASVTASFVPVNRPDGLVAHAAGGFAGDDVFNTTGAGQMQSVKVSRGHSTTFRWRIVNDGVSTDTMRLKGAGSSTGFSVTYFAGRTNLTKSIVAGTVSATLDPGASVTFTVKVTVLRGARVSSKKSVLMSARSGHAAVSDVVLARVVAGR